MSTLKDRFIEARERTGLNPAQLAAKIGVKPAAIYLIESGDTLSLKGETLVAVCQLSGVTERWLQTGQGRKLCLESQISDESGTYAVATNETRPGYIRFELYDAFASAGYGAMASDYPEVIHNVEVAEWWAKSNLRGNLERVKLMTARGDSMADEINNGDILFIDSSVQNFQGDGIYVINHGGYAKVKQLQVMRDGSMAIVSLNKRYQTEMIPKNEMDQLYVGGILLGSMPFKRF